MLSDKDIAAFTVTLAAVTDDWYLATPGGERGLSARTLAGVLDNQNYGKDARQFASVGDALGQAEAEAVAGDRIVVCGSFITVAEALASHV
jgi:dihydrofolate synthase/folylpolyglutamate synthase